MELQARFHGLGVSARGWLGGVRTWGTSATPGVLTLAERAGSVQLESRDTMSERWKTTLTRARWVRRGIGGHELSKPSVIDLS